jgi:hypothetical protein
MAVTATNEYASEGHVTVAEKSQARSKALRVCMIAYSVYETDNRVMRYE